MNTETPKRKRAPRKRKIVVLSEEIKHENEHKVTDEIKQRVDLNAIEMKMIHGLDEEKPTIERTQPKDVAEEINRIIRSSEDTIVNLQKLQKKLKFRMRVVCILFTVAIIVIAWNIYRLITLLCH